MLGIYEAPWELIREDTFTNDSSANHTITVDGNGQAFELSDVILQFETPQQSTYSAMGSYGQIHFYVSDNDKIICETGAWTQNAETSPH